MFTKTSMSTATQIIIATQMAFNGWMNKQLWYSLTMEYYWAIRRNKLLHGWVPKALHWVKEATFKGYILHASIYMKFCKRENYSDREDYWLPGIRGGMRVGLQRGRLREIFRMMESFCIQFVAGVTQIYTFVKAHGTVHQNKKESFLLYVNI